jgi:acetyl esterase/lipase
MRYAFAQLPNNVIKTFFHRDVALRFTEYRYRAKPERKDWEEVEENGVRGIWIKKHQDREPDFVLYYIHGGGYVYGSVWFYLQWLHAFHTTLCPYFNNPAIFALSYSPAPQSTYPTQVKEACNGYAYALKAILDDAGKLCLAGDSAGAALAMMVVHKLMLEGSQKLPKQVLLISPWLSLNPTLAFVTDSDFVTTAGLRACAKAYAPSPEYGTNEDASVMRRLSSHWPERSNLLGDQLPRPIFHVWYGKNETVHDEIEAACHILQLKGWEVRRILEGAPDKAIHVWPVASFFLGRDQGRRLESLKKLSAKLR